MPQSTESALADFLIVRYKARLMENHTLSLRHWAKEMGIGPATLISLMNTKKKVPSRLNLDTLQRFVSYFGSPILEVLGIKAQEIRVLADEKTLYETKLDKLIKDINTLDKEEFRILCEEIEKGKKKKSRK
jgi:transcriptional regulator with XRE-family HTH domain